MANGSQIDSGMVTRPSRHAPCVEGAEGCVSLAVAAMTMNVTGLAQVVAVIRAVALPGPLSSTAVPEPRSSQDTRISRWLGPSILIAALTSAMSIATPAGR